MAGQQSRCPTKPERIKKCRYLLVSESILTFRSVREEAWEHHFQARASPQCADSKHKIYCCFKQLGKVSSQSIHVAGKKDWEIMVISTSMVLLVHRGGLVRKPELQLPHLYSQSCRRQSIWRDIIFGFAQIKIRLHSCYKPNRSVSDG